MPSSFRIFVQSSPLLLHAPLSESGLSVPSNRVEKAFGPAVFDVLPTAVIFSTNGYPEGGSSSSDPGIPITRSAPRRFHFTVLLACRRVPVVFFVGQTSLSTRG